MIGWKQANLLWIGFISTAGQINARANFPSHVNNK